MSSTGFVNQAFQNMVNWQWFHDVPVRILFEYLLHIVNLDDKTECGICIKSGSVLVTISQLEKATCLSTRQIRTALSKLSSTNEISVITSRQNGTIISITEWLKYKYDNAYAQNSDNASKNMNDKRTTNERQTEVVDNDDDTCNNDKRTTNERQTNDAQEPQNEHNDKRTTNERQTENHGNQQVTWQADKRTTNERQTEASLKEQENDKEKKKDISTPIEKIKEKEKEKENAPFETPSSQNPTKSKRTYHITFNPDEQRFEGITSADMQSWESAYPSLDINNQLHSMIAWLYNNPSKRKSDYPRFINNWLQSEAHKAQNNMLLFAPSKPLVPYPKNEQEVLTKAKELRLDITVETASAFFNYHAGLGWYKGQQPIADWTCFLKNWVQREQQFQSFGTSGSYNKPTESKPFDPSKYEN